MQWHRPAIKQRSLEALRLQPLGRATAVCFSMVLDFIQTIRRTFGKHDQLGIANKTRRQPITATFGKLYLKVLQDKLEVMNNSSQKKIVTHRFEPTSKYILLFIGGLALSLVLSIWGNLTLWREHQNWEEADLKYRALKMVLPSDDPNIHYIEKHFSVCRDEKVIDDVRNHVAAYEDSVLKYNEMVRMAAYKDSIAKQLVKESDNIKRTINSSK